MPHPSSTEPCSVNGANTSWMTGPRGRPAFAVAAILLVLHWAAPAFRTFDSAATQAPGYSTAHLAAHPGTLPRSLMRTQAFEAGVKKPEPTDLPPLEKSKAFHQKPVPAAPDFNAAPAAIVHGATPPTLAAASFEARGPPRPLA